MSFHAQSSGGILISIAFAILRCHLIKIDGRFLLQCHFALFSFAFSLRMLSFGLVE